MTAHSKSPTPESPSENEEEPQVFSVSRDINHHFSFTRRNFLEVAAVTSLAAVVSRCAPLNPADKAPAPEEPATPEPSSTPTIDSTPTQEPSPSSTPYPSAVVLPAELAVLFGPNPNSQVTGKLLQGEVVTVLGRTQNAAWIRIQSPNGINGWVESSQVTYNGDLQALRMVTLEPSPTPSPLPGEVGTVSPGAVGVEYTYVDEQGRTLRYTLPCGSEIPPGAVCTCNCVSVPTLSPCACEGYVVSPSCSCDSYSGSTCSCDVVTYWYPN